MERLTDVKPVNRVEIKSDKHAPHAEDGRIVDIRIYVSPKAIALAVAAIAIVSRLIELISTLVIN
uniref:Uncharacterized protein n=1 Tax=Leviviridae sp. TaxID=2027243 RepID=A0A514D9T5_9VIRU|nr:MAG: hypothetical protein H2Bulk3536615_000001 [Leviviridae sp.]QDH90375.1 MAG: hypothetical protein H4Rhizo441355_000002 [Leviviridae sp.]